MNKIISLVISLVALFGVIGIAAPAVANAQTAAQIACETAGGQYTSGNCTNKSGQRDVSSAIKTAVTILSFVSGTAAIIMVIIGGIKYTTSGGDSNGVASAKNTLLYAVIGLVIALLAQALVRFVFGKAT